MSSDRESKWSPQPPNLQALEKKEAAAMPVMVAAALEMTADSDRGSGGGSSSSSGGERTAVRTAGATGGGAPPALRHSNGERGRARWGWQAHRKVSTKKKKEKQIFEL